MLNGHKGAYGLSLIERFARGEKLGHQEIQSMRATMYLLSNYAKPPRAWEDFRWRGQDHFIQEVWPLIRDRKELLSGLFGHGAVSP
ncbi:MAG: hypothetical protein GTO14_11985 [Anaerolineales bacterium]|nr:hypothetical protein [Anaerolineales bacterium]